MRDSDDLFLNLDRDKNIINNPSTARRAIKTQAAWTKGKRLQKACEIANGA